MQHIRIITTIDDLLVTVEYQLPRDTDKFMEAFRELRDADIPFQMQVKT
jgi:hypothetical protein